jgi:hypothetical protein
MKKCIMALTGAIVLMAASARADKPLKDYGFIRGACYGGWQRDEATVRKELGYAQRLQLNSTRIWLSTRISQGNPAALGERLRNYIRIAHSMGISTMPILFNGNGLNPQTLKPESWPQQEAYVKSVVEAVKNEPGLLMWDIMNEPSWNDYINKATKEELPKRQAEIKEFLAHFTKYVKSLDPVNATTIGHTYPSDLEWCTDVDVFCFHDYRETRKIVEENYVLAEGIAKKYNKPLINSELSCVCRANPYDMSLEICQRHKIGWYVFQLMISGGWADVHGLVYPDGTIRDPSIIAAIYGFQRKRDPNAMVKENPNREGHARKALDKLNAALAGTGGKKSSTDDILEAAEYCANLLEAAQMVSMREPPTAKILSWRAQRPEQRDEAAIRKYANELGQTLRENCNLP